MGFVKDTGLVMKSRRAPGQTLVNFPIKGAFLEFLDSNLESLGFSDRSKFIREALREKLIQMGKDCPPELVLPPGRAGKGGRPKFSYPVLRPAALSLNDKPSSRPPSAAESLLDAVGASEQGPHPKSRRKQ